MKVVPCRVLTIARSIVDTLGVARTTQTNMAACESEDADTYLGTAPVIGSTLVYESSYMYMWRIRLHTYSYEVDCVHVTAMS